MNTAGAATGSNSSHDGGMRIGRHMSGQSVEDEHHAYEGKTHLDVNNNGSLRQKVQGIIDQLSKSLGVDVAVDHHQLGTVATNRFSEFGHSARASWIEPLRATSSTQESLAKEFGNITFRGNEDVVNILSGQMLSGLERVTNAGPSARPTTVPNDSSTNISQSSSISAFKSVAKMIQTTIAEHQERHEVERNYATEAENANILQRTIEVCAVIK